MQRIFKRGWLLVWMGIIGGTAFGQNKSQKFTHSFGLAVEHAHYNYREPDVRQNKDFNRYGAWWAQWKGNTWGGSGFYRLTWKETLFAQPEVRILYGNHQYNWGQQNRIVSKTNHSIPSLIFEPRLIMGGHFLSYKNITLSPYSGFGYHFKSDDGDDVTCNDGEKLGFYRKSNYVYVPLGASADYAINDTWSISLKGEYDWIVKAWHIDKSIGDPTMKFKQPNGYGLKGEVSFGYFYNTVKFSLSPYLNYWNIRNSEIKDRAREPYNVTFESGIKLGVTF